MLQTLRKQDWFHEDGFPIAVERRDPQQPFGLHCHCYSQSRNEANRSLLLLANSISHIERHFAEPIVLDDLVGMNNHGCACVA